MKFNKVVLAVAFVFAMAVGAAALAVVDARSGSFRMPRDEQGAADASASWTGSTIRRVEASATAVSVFVGEGLVDGICVTSGVADGYAAIGDSAVGANFSATIAGYIVHRQYTNPAVSPLPASGAGCSYFDPPIRVAAGLAIKNSAADVLTYVRYRITKQ